MIGHIINGSGVKRQTSGGLKLLKLVDDENLTKNEKVKFNLKK